MYFINEKGEKTYSIETAWEWKKAGLKVKQFVFVLGVGSMWEINF
jgi:hypothetical protein